MPRGTQHVHLVARRRRCAASTAPSSTRCGRDREQERGPSRSRARPPCRSRRRSAVARPRAPRASLRAWGSRRRRGPRARTPRPRRCSAAGADGAAARRSGDVVRRARPASAPRPPAAAAGARRACASMQRPRHPARPVRRTRRGVPEQRCGRARVAGPARLQRPGLRATAASSTARAAAAARRRRAGAASTLGRVARAAPQTARRRQRRIPATSHEQPARAHVRAGAEPVHERDRPARVGEPVDRAPGPQAEPARSRLVIASASSRSNATAPRPEPERAVRRATSGITASIQADRPRTGRARDVAMCTARNTSASSERLRCRRVDGEARARAARRRSACAPMPSATIAGEQDERDDARRRARGTRATRREDRTRHGAPLAGSSGQPATVITSPSRSHEAGGQRRPASQPSAALAEHDRRGAGDVGLEAGRGGDADGAPDGVGRRAGARVDDVVHGATPPRRHARTRRARRGEAARA